MQKVELVSVQKRVLLDRVQNPDQRSCMACIFDLGVLSYERSDNLLHLNWSDNKQTTRLMSAMIARDDSAISAISAIGCAA